MEKLHDAYLAGLFVANHSALVFAQKSGEKICLRLSDVDSLIANNFRQGNIILDIEVITGTEVSKYMIIDAIGANDGHVGEEYISNMLSRFKHNDASIVRINPSYGCELVCICRHVEFIREGILVEIEEFLK